MFLNSTEQKCYVATPLMALCLIAGLFSNRRKISTLVFRKDLTRITPKMYKIIATKQIGSQTKIRGFEGGDIIWGLGRRYTCIES